MRKSENDGEEFKVEHSRIPKNTEAKARERKKSQAVSNCYAVSLFELE